MLVSEDFAEEDSFFHFGRGGLLKSEGKWCNTSIS